MTDPHSTLPTTTPRDAGSAGGLWTNRPWAALGLAAGPIGFVTAWIVGGARTPNYSPVYDAISRIAAVEAPQRATMNVGFVVFGAGLIAGSVALRESPLARGWTLAAVNGVAAFAVALTPLEGSDTVDLLHGLSATVGYVSLAALPLVVAPELRRLGYRRAATASIAVGLATGACLVGTTLTDANGLFQRLGLGIGDVWLISTGIALWRGSKTRAERTRPTA